jgi:hypothetical protein
MRASGLVASATLSAVAVSVSMAIATATTPFARASEGDGSINGTYVATSDGVWATTNDRYHDEATVRSTWTISSSCPNKVDCTGWVTSDQGWSAALTKRNSLWVLVRELPQWEPCADGTFGHGKQMYQFYPVDDSGNVNPDSSTFAGHDQTVGDSGACGRNKSLVIDLPFTMTKTG